MFREGLQTNHVNLKWTKFIMVAYSLLCAVSMHAQVADLPPYTNFWHRFTSNEDTFRMALFFTEGGEVNGYYYYNIYTTEKH